MMKEQAIQKINKIGKISSVIALIAKIVVGIALICTLIGTIVWFLIPDQLITFTTKGVLELEVDLGSVGMSIPEEELETAQAEMLAAMNEGSQGIESTEFTVTQDMVKMVGSVEEVSFSVSELAWVVLLALVALVMTFITLCFISSLCKAFRDCQS